MAVISTHPIQYRARWFCALAAHSELDLHVLYCYQASPADQAHAGFGIEFDWEIPLLEGYRRTFLNGTRGNRWSFSALEARRIAQMLAREDMDVVLVNGWHYKASWQAIFACWKARIPVMVWGDSQLASPRGRLKRLCGLFFDQLWRPSIDVEQIVEKVIESQCAGTRLEEAAHA